MLHTKSAKSKRPHVSAILFLSAQVYLGLAIIGGESGVTAPFSASSSDCELTENKWPSFLSNYITAGSTQNSFPGSRQWNLAKLVDDKRKAKDQDKCYQKLFNQAVIDAREFWQLQKERCSKTSTSKACRDKVAQANLDYIANIETRESSRAPRKGEVCELGSQGSVLAQMKKLKDVIAHIPPQQDDRNCPTQLKSYIDNEGSWTLKTFAGVDVKEQCATNGPAGVVLAKAFSTPQKPEWFAGNFEKHIVGRETHTGFRTPIVTADSCKSYFGKMDDRDKARLISDYYFLESRLNGSELALLETAQEFNHALDGKTDDQFCALGSTPKAQAWCKISGNCPREPNPIKSLSQGPMKAAYEAYTKLVDTKIAIEQRTKIVGRAGRRQYANQDDAKADKRIDAAIDLLRQGFPIFGQKAFDLRMNQKGSLEDRIRQQFQLDRTAVIEKVKKTQFLAQCLRTNSYDKECHPSKMEDFLKSTPTSIEHPTIKELTDQGTNIGSKALNKEAVVKSAMSRSQLCSDLKTNGRESDKMVAEGAAAAVLTIATVGVGSVAAGAIAAGRTGLALTASSIAAGADLGVAAAELSSAVKRCGLEGKTSMATNPVIFDERAPSCANKTMAVQAVELQDCTMDVALAVGGLVLSVPQLRQIAKLRKTSMVDSSDLKLTSIADEADDANDVNRNTTTGDGSLGTADAQSDLTSTRSGFTGGGWNIFGRNDRIPRVGDSNVKIEQVKLTSNGASQRAGSNTRQFGHTQFFFQNSSEELNKLAGKQLGRTDFKRGLSVRSENGEVLNFQEINTQTGEAVFLDPSGKPRVFQTGYIKADSYVANVTLPDGQIHQIRIKSARTMNAAEDNRRTAEKVRKLIAELPAERVKDVDEITINLYPNKDDDHWRSVYKDFSSSAATGGGSNGISNIDFYPSKDFGKIGNMTAEIFAHEFGHATAYKTWGSTKPPDTWIKAMGSDGKAVSKYAENSIDEDWAETVALYLQTDAGRLDKSTRNQFQNRFNELDSYFKVNPKEKIQLAQKLNQISILTVPLAGGGVASYAYYTREDGRKVLVGPPL